VYEKFEIDPEEFRNSNRGTETVLHIFIDQISTIKYDEKEAANVTKAIIELSGKFINRNDPLIYQGFNK